MPINREIYTYSSKTQVGIMKLICGIFLIEPQMLANVYDLLFYINLGMFEVISCPEAIIQLFMTTAPRCWKLQSTIFHESFFFHVRFIESCNTTTQLLPLSCRFQNIHVGRKNAEGCNPQILRLKMENHCTVPPANKYKAEGNHILAVGYASEC